MNGHQLTIAVVVCCHTQDRWTSIAGVMAALETQLSVEDEVVLVVDRNTALYHRAVEEFPFASVVENSGGAGLSGARNTGIAASSAPIVAFIDDDALPTPGWAQGIRTAFGEHSVAMIGGEVIAHWPTRSGAPRWFPDEFGWVVGCDYRGMAHLGTPIRNPIGANMAVRRSVLDTVGAFRPDLGRGDGTPSGCEETELAIRLTDSIPGARVLRVADTAVLHHVSQDRCTRGYFVRRCFAEGRSKAALTRISGPKSGLGSEFSYVTAVLPRSLVRHTVGALTGNPGGLARARWVILGFLATMLGWITARSIWSSSGSRGGQQHAALVPVDNSHASIPVRTIDLAELPEEHQFPRPNPLGRQWLLITVQGSPLGMLDVQSEPGIGQREHVLTQVKKELSHPLRAHLGLLYPDCHHESLDDVGLMDILGQTGLRRNPRFGAGSSTPITVIVCTLGRHPALAEAVRSILKQTHSPLTLIVVDNDPESRRAQQILADIDDERLVVIEESSRGVSAARNAGLAAARDSLVAFTDDDVEADPTWIERIVEIFDADQREEVACVTGLVLPAELATPAQLWFEESTGFEKGFDTMIWSPSGTAPQTVDPLICPGNRGPVYPFAGSEFGSGNSMAFRRDWLVAAGGFDESLGTGTPARGGEDLDVFRRVILSAQSLVYTPAAIVRHHHRETYRELRSQMYGYGVGMCANLLRHMTSSPRGAWEILTSLPRGFRELSDPQSQKNHNKSPLYPTLLTVIELLGYLFGPVHFARSVVRRQIRSRNTAKSRPVTGPRFRAGAASGICTADRVLQAKRG